VSSESATDGRATQDAVAEGIRIDNSLFYLSPHPRQLLGLCSRLDPTDSIHGVVLHCSTSCIHAVVSLSLREKGLLRLVCCVISCLWCLRHGCCILK